MFKRRDRRSLGRALLESLWPRGGWGRAAQYVRHRLRRLPDSPERIARGIMAGVFTTFTPLYGLHFLISALLAWAMRGNILASLLATFFGNPLTYVPIGVISLQTGHFLLGTRPPEHGPHSIPITEKFLNAGDELWFNFVALFTPAEPHWDGLKLFYDDVFFPYLVGGLIPGAIAGVIAYYVSLPLISAYQKRRAAAIARKAAARAEAEAQMLAAASVEQDKLRLERAKEKALSTAKGAAATAKAAANKATGGKKGSNPA